MKKDLFLGIDGGGSKTAGVLIDSGGKILAKYRTIGSAIIGKPSPRSCSTLLNLIENLCAKARVKKESIARCGIGLNGIDFEDEYPLQLSEIARCTGIHISKIELVNDGIVALWGATDNEAAIILQHGSGLTSAYRRQHGDEQFFDGLDIGSIFDIRREVISIVARMIDGRAKTTDLKERVLDYLGVSEDKYAEVLYRNKIPAAKLLLITPVVYDSWVDGDPVAADLVCKAIDDYVLTVKVMIKKIGKKKIDVCLGGGVISAAPDKFWSDFIKKFDNDTTNISVKPPALLPEFGAAIMAAFNTGSSPVEFFNKVLNSYNNYKEAKLDNLRKRSVMWADQ